MPGTGTKESNSLLKNRAGRRISSQYSSEIDRSNGGTIDAVDLSPWESRFVSPSSGLRLQPLQPVKVINRRHEGEQPADFLQTS